MNQMVELVTAWAKYESHHPKANLEEFCRWFLAKGRSTGSGLESLFDGDTPPRADIVLAKMIDRLARLHMIYVRMVMGEVKIDHFEEFSLLSAISNLKSPRKTEVIYHTINELSTGLNLLSDMKNRGYISEHDDPEDGRSKRLRLTPKGEKILKACYQRFAKVPQMLFNDMTEDDIRLCIQLLKNVEKKFSQLWLQHKGKKLNQVQKEVNE